MASGVLALLASSCAADAASSSVAVEQAPISGGSAVPKGAWPILAWLENGCSGVLLAPDLVVFAAHCGLQAGSAWFGDQLEITVDDAAGVAPAASGPGVTRVGLSGCTAYPDWEIGTDIAYCFLEHPVVDPSAIAPALPACARSRLVPGITVSLVGFGRSAPATPAGTKRRVDVPIRHVGQELEIGDSDSGTCTGDSGSPALIALGDQTHPDWHVAGVLSTGSFGDGCGVGYYTDVSALTPWLERSSGRDLSPCFDDDGQLSSSRCAQASLDADGLPSAGTIASSAACVPSAPRDSGCSFVPRAATDGGRCGGLSWLNLAAVAALRRRRHAFAKS